MTIAEVLTQRRISEALHFTTNRGLVGVLSCRRALSRFRLPDEKSLEHLWRANSQWRPESSESFDKSNNWLDFVNMSISEVNSRYFLVSSNKWHASSELWWVIMSFSSEVMTHDGVYFTTTNNGYDQCLRAPGKNGLEALFVPLVQRKSPSWEVRREQRPPDLPTCEQAEILYPQELSIDYLRRVYVRDADQRDAVAGWLREFNIPDVEVILDPGKFFGRPN